MLKNEGRDRPLLLFSRTHCASCLQLVGAHMQRYLVTNQLPSTVSHPLSMCDCKLMMISLMEDLTTENFEH